MKVTKKILLIFSLFGSISFMHVYAQFGGGIDKPFQKEEAQVIQTLEDTMQSVKEGDVDRLIAFHAYNDKFTEFKEGKPRNNGQENEEFERGVFGNVSEVVKMEAKDLKVAVFHGKVANVTLHSDFHLKFGDDLVIVNDQITLLFAKTNKGEWKIVHEHHSPLSGD